MLAVIGALEEEVDLIQAAMTVSGRQTHAGIETVRGDFGGVEIVLAQCGVGKVNATICTQMLIDHYQPGALVFSGVAGGLLPNMRIGDVVIASHTAQPAQTPHSLRPAYGNQGVPPFVNCTVYSEPTLSYIIGC